MRSVLIVTGTAFLHARLHACMHACLHACLLSCVQSGYFRPSQGVSTISGCCPDLMQFVDYVRKGKGRGAFNVASSQGRKLRPPQKHRTPRTHWPPPTPFYAILRRSSINSTALIPLTHLHDQAQAKCEICLLLLRHARYRVSVFFTDIVHQPLCVIPSPRAVCCGNEPTWYHLQQRSQQHTTNACNRHRIFHVQCTCNIACTYDAKVYTF